MNTTINFIKQNKVKLFVLFFSIILSIFAFTKNIDEVGVKYTDDSLKQAFIVFATAKALNAIVSLLQGTEIGPPGANFSIGEVLDPLNDLIEQFSWIMLASIASIGLQQILMELFSYIWFNIFLVISVFGLNLYLFIKVKKDIGFGSKAVRYILIILFIRFAIPFMVIANQFVYEHIVQNKYNIEISNQKLNVIEEGLSTTEDKVEQQKEEGVIDRIMSSVNLSEKIDKYKQKYEEYKQNTKDATVYITNLIIVFIFQTVFFPILFLFILYKLIKNDFFWRRD